VSEIPNPITTPEFNLFNDVQITELDGSLSFYVPEREIEIAGNGVWKFWAEGHRQWAKEHDDYGDVRFLRSGLAFWTPGMYPFEEIDTTGMPVILDQERCKMTVQLQPVLDSRATTTCRIQSQNGSYFAKESASSYNAAGINFFDEFEQLGRPMTAQIVEFPEIKWPSLSAYAQDEATRFTEDDYANALLGNGPIPYEYEQQFIPYDYRRRETWQAENNAFGQVWVPVDRLLTGNQATVSFTIRR